MSPVEALNRLIVNEMQAGLGAAVIGRQITVLEQTDSTNDAILRISTPNSDEGLVLFAEHQTPGADSEAIAGSRRRGKGFGSPSCCNPGST